MSILIDGINPATVLSALYNAAKKPCIGPYCGNVEPMSEDEASSLILNNPSKIFNTPIKGRTLRIRLDQNLMITKEYNSANGEGLAESIIRGLKTNTELPESVESLPDSHYLIEDNQVRY